MAAFLASAPAAATWKCLRSGWRWWERRRRGKRLAVLGKEGMGMVADEIRRGGKWMGDLEA